MLQLTRGSTYFFEVVISFPSIICPEVELLDHMMESETVSHSVVSDSVTPWTGSYDNSIFNFLRQLYTVIQCQTLFFWAPKSLQMVTAAMKLKDAYSFEGKLCPT